MISYGIFMRKTRPILIGCPQYQRMVRGTYACGPDGRFLLSADGSFAVARVRCAHDGGRCAQTLCVLHRYNRRGGSSWYPSRILAAPQPNAPPKRARRPAPRKKSDTDLLC